MMKSSWCTLIVLSPPIWKLIESLVLSATCLILTMDSLLSRRFSCSSFFFHSISLSQLQILIFWWPALIIPFCFRANLVWSKAAWRMHDLIWNVLASCRNTYLKCIPAKLRQENPKFETSLGSIVISNPLWSSLKIYIPLLNKPTAQLVCAVQ